MGLHGAQDGAKEVFHPGFSSHTAKLAGPPHIKPVGSSGGSEKGLLNSPKGRLKVTNAYRSIASLCKLLFDKHGDDISPHNHKHSILVRQLDR